MKVVYYSQYDERWDDVPYPSKEKPTATIETSACNPTCAAMVVATFVNPKVTPVDMAKLAMKLGDRVNGGTADVFNSHVAKEYSIPFSQILKDDVAKNKAGSLKTAIEALKNGSLVICRMKDWFKPGAGHFILAHGMSGDKIQIYDPASRANNKPHDQSIFINKCIGYFIYSEPKMTTEEAVKFMSEHAKIDYETWLNNAKSKKIMFLDLCFEKIAKAWKESLK